MIELAIDLLPFPRLKLVYLGTRRVTIYWLFPITHPDEGLTLMLSTTVDITSWS